MMQHNFADAYERGKAEPVYSRQQIFVELAKAEQKFAQAKTERLQDNWRMQIAWLRGQLASSR